MTVFRRGRDDNWVSDTLLYDDNNISHWGHWWRPLQPTSSIITEAKSVDSNLVDFDRKTCLDQPVWKSAWMTSAQLSSRRHHWPWADVIRADFQTVISRYLHNVNTRLFCTADRMFRTIIMQTFRLIYACFPIKIDEVWIDRFCVRYDWWRRLQPTSSVSPMWYMALIHMRCAWLPSRCC